MAQQDVLLIHGTWGHGQEWDDFGAELTTRGYRVHAPTLPAHGRPGDIDIWGAAEQVAKLGLLDYVNALVETTRTMETPPLIIGHSLGGLLAQLVAARIPHRGVVLLGPAPAAGMFAFYPSMAALWARYIPRWILGRPMFPVAKRVWDRFICNASDAEFSESLYADLCAESGTAYREMVFWMFDRKKSARLDYDRITGDVLVIAGEQDKCCVPALCRATARRYGPRAHYVELAGSDHFMLGGPHMPAALAAFDAWADSKGIAGAAAES